MATGTMRPREALAALVGEGLRDPYPLYEEMRAHGDLVRIKPGVMAAVGYDECDRVLRDPRLRVQDGDSFDLFYPAWRAHSSLRAYTDSMLYSNPPAHTRLRRLLRGEFTPRRVAGYETAIEQITDRLLDSLAEEGAGGAPVDFIAGFASRLPIAVISGLLGVPERDQAWFRSIAADVTTALEGITNASKLAPADAAMDDLAVYFDELIERRRGCPEADLVSSLVRVHDDGGGLERDELVGNMMLLLTAGFETTNFFMAHALLLSFENPHLAGRLRAEPGFASAYAEEVLRFEPPVQATSRWAGADVELLGTTVPAGTKVVAILAAGNRDPRRFHRPDRFDPDRPYTAPLTFGAGGHFCLGAPLSRLEARIALPRLLRRFPRIRPAGEPVRRDSWVGRGIDHFPIAID